MRNHHGTETGLKGALSSGIRENPWKCAVSISINNSIVIIGKNEGQGRANQQQIIYYRHVITLLALKRILFGFKRNL